MTNDAFKICPFCKEKIRASAIKCRYCGEWLEAPAEAVAPEQPKTQVDMEATSVLPAEPTPESTMPVNQASSQVPTLVPPPLPATRAEVEAGDTADTPSPESAAPVGDEKYMPLDMREEPERRSSVTDYVEYELEKRGSRHQNGSSKVTQSAPDGVSSQPPYHKSGRRYRYFCLLSIGIIGTCIGRSFGLHNPDAYTAGGIVGYFLGVLVGYCLTLGIIGLIVAALRGSVRRSWFPTFAWLFLLAGLFDIAVKGYSEFILYPQVHTLVDGGKQPPLAAKDHAASDTEELAVAVSQALHRISPNDITKEFEEKMAAAPIVYTSPADGFSATFPNQPTFTEVAAKEAHTHNYQAYSVDGLVSYNVFVNLFEKKILSPDSQAAFFKNHLVGRLALLTKPQVIRDDPTTYNGLPGRDFAYLEAGIDPPVLFRGVVFLLDGDAISLSMLYATGTVPQYSFEDFVKSFRLLSLPASLSDEYWQDAETGLRLRVPSDMQFLKGGNSSTGRIASFASAAGHSLIVFNVSSINPSITMGQIQSELSGIEKDKDGWYRSTVAASISQPRMVQLMKYLQTPSGIYVIQGYGPENSFFRSEAKVKAASETLVIPSR